MVKLQINQYETPFTSWEFPGGEVGVKVDAKIKRTDNVKITVDGIVTTKDIFILMNLADAIYNIKETSVGTWVYMPYFPYARQDRICHAGESAALQRFICMIRDLEWLVQGVSIVDPHSSAVQCIIDQQTDITLFITEQHEKANEILGYFTPYDFVIAPDAGALEKSKKFSVHSKHVFLNKTRKDSRVIYEDYPWDTIRGRAIVVDDIADGGATFISLGNMLRRTQPNLQALDLYVTHGIFSKGVDSLLEVYDNVSCFNNMNNLNLKGTK